MEFQGSGEEKVYGEVRAVNEVEITIFYPTFRTPCEGDRNSIETS